MEDRDYYEEMWAKPANEDAGCRSYYPAKAVKNLLYSLEKPKDSETAIDVGCGIGRHTELLLQRGYHTIGLDFSSHALRKLRKRLPLVEIIQADVTNIPLNSSIASLILDSGCLHHLNPSLYESYLKELNRIIKPRKHLILYQFKMRGNKRSNLEGNHFTKYFSEEELKSIFAKDWEFVSLNSVVGETGKPYWAGLLKKK